MFETERLTVRRFAPEDAVRLYEIHRDESVKKWMPNEYYEDISEAGEAIEFFAGCVDAERLPYVLAVVCKATGELIGDVGVNEVDGCDDEVEIGYVICRECMGRGYATELVRAMTDFISARFGIKTLFGRVLHGNDASVRVLEKCGYGFVTEESGAEDDPYGAGMLIYRKNC